MPTGMQWLARIPALLIATLPLSAAPPPASAECAVPQGIVLEPGQSLRLGDRVVELRATVRPLPGAPQRARSDGEGAYELDFDLLVRMREPRSGKARAGTYEPFLDGSYRLAGDSPDSPGGRLSFRLSAAGPAYGATLTLDGGRPPFDLSLMIDRRSGTSWQPESGAMCAALPISLAFRIDPAGLVAPASAPVVRAPADDRRITVLSNLDARPSQNYSDVWGYTNGATHLAMIGTTQGTLFIDVTDPANPQEVAFIEGPASSWRDIKTYQTYAYIVTEGTGTGDGMQIIDLSDPLAPVLVARYKQTFVTAHNVYIDTDTAQAWCVGTNDGTRILSLQNPVAPVEIGSFTARYVHDAYVADGLAYLSEINNGLHEIVDSTDPANLQVLSSWQTPGSASHNSWANDDHTVLATTDEVTRGHVAVYDIAIKTGPVPLLSEYEVNPSAIVHNVVFDDENNERIAIAHYGLGLKYVDLHRPTAPVELGSYDTRPSSESGTAGAWGVYPFDSRGYIYVSDIQTGLYVLRYDPSGGVVAGTVRDDQGTPLSAARITLLPQALEATSGPDGVWALYADPGEIALRASMPGFRTRLLDAGTLALDGKLDADIEMERLPAGSLSGIVRRASDLSPVADAVVTVAELGLSTATAADGSYAFAEVAIGQQTVTVDAFGFSPGDARARVHPGQPLVMDLLLDPGFFVDDAETDQGWALGQASDTATSGHWERVDPNGTQAGEVQPEDDRTPDPGVHAFITGQSPPGADREDNDVEGGVTSLLTPAFDLSALDVARLSYHRWVSVGGDFLPGGAMRVEVTSDNGRNWTTIDFEDQEANSWMRREFDLGALGALSDGVRVRFRAEPSAGLEEFKVLECGIDDVEIVQICGTIFNPQAPDTDGDGTIDDCDPCALDAGNDEDADGVCGELDNAPQDSNPVQADGDADSVGDVADNCPATANAAQRDQDGDGLGDACDSDQDGDGIEDAADDDRDDDGVADLTDLCPSVPDRAQLDRDLDGVGDACDDDDGIVQGLRLAFDRMTWEPELAADSYNLYRGDLGSPALLTLAACRVAGVPGNHYIDPLIPTPGDGYFYLAAVVGAGGEGPLGYDGGGTQRTVTQPCP